MTTEEIHARCVALLRERTTLQREVRPKLERIREIERRVARLDAKRAAQAEDRERSLNSQQSTLN